MTRKTIIIKI